MRGRGGRGSGFGVFGAVLAWRSWLMLISLILREFTTFHSSPQALVNGIRGCGSSLKDCLFLCS